MKRIRWSYSFIFLMAPIFSLVSCAFFQPSGVFDPAEQQKASRIETVKIDLAYAEEKNKVYSKQLEAARSENTRLRERLHDASETIEKLTEETETYAKQLAAILKENTDVKNQGLHSQNRALGAQKQKLERSNSELKQGLEKTQKEAEVFRTQLALAQDTLKYRADSIEHAQAGLKKLLAENITLRHSLHYGRGIIKVLGMGSIILFFAGFFVGRKSALKKKNSP